MRSNTILATLFLANGLPFSVVVADPVVPGFNVETYAEIVLPSGMSFDPLGNLFVGSGGAGADPSWVYKVPPGGIPETYGAGPIPDPDSVIFDATGIISDPGSVLVGGGGSVYAISPNTPHSVVVVLSGLTNINELAFDSRGRLLMLDQMVGVYWSTGDPPVLLFSDVSNTMAVDSNDLIYTGGVDGVIRVHDANGDLIDDAFATGLGGDPPIEVGRGGTWGTDVYAIDWDSGELLRITASGTQTVVGTGFLWAWLEFGPDDALYVSEFANNRILRIAPACSGDLDHDGDVDLDDFALFQQQFAGPE